MTRHRVRIRFAKTGDGRFLSHRDLARTWDRTFRRARLPLAMSQGFHPHPLIMFPAALAVGVSGRNEIVEVELTEPWTAEQTRAALAPKLPEWLAILSVEEVGGRKKALAARMTFRLAVPPERRPELRRAVDEFLNAATWVVTRAVNDAPDEPGQELDLRPLVDEVTLDDDGLQFAIRCGGAKQARPREILALLGIADLEHSGEVLERTAVELTPESA